MNVCFNMSVQSPGSWRFHPRQDRSQHLHSQDQRLLSQGPGRDQYHGMGDPEHARTITWHGFPGGYKMSVKCVY